MDDHRSALVRISVILFLFSGSFAPLFSDTIQLKNGKRYQGDIVNQTRQIIEIETTSGKKKIQKTTIRKVMFGSPSLDELKNEAKRRAAEEQAKRRAAEEQAKREAAEEEEKRRAAEEQAKREAAEEEEKRRAAEEQAKREATGGETKERYINPYDSSLLWRSAVLPGWGMYHANRRVAAYNYGGIATGSLFTGLYFSQRAKLYKKKYNENTTMAVALRLYNPENIGGFLISGSLDSLLATLAQGYFENQATENKEIYQNSVNIQYLTYTSFLVVYGYQLWSSYRRGTRLVEDPVSGFQYQRKAGDYRIGVSPRIFVQPETRAMSPGGDVSFTYYF